jgi:hypothetical protein
MGFQHEQQSVHKMRGMSQAIASAKTPAHLKPHLRQKLKEHQMAAKMPITGAKPEMKPKGTFSTLTGTIQRPPDPFKNPTNTAATGKNLGQTKSGLPSANVGTSVSGVGKGLNMHKNNLKPVSGSKIKTMSKVAGGFYGR